MRTIHDRCAIAGLGGPRAGEERARSRLNIIARWNPTAPAPRAAGAQSAARGEPGRHSRRSGIDAVLLATPHSAQAPGDAAASASNRCFARNRWRSGATTPPRCSRPAAAPASLSRSGITEGSGRRYRHYARSQPVANSARSCCRGPQQPENSGRHAGLAAVAGGIPGRRTDRRGTAYRRLRQPAGSRAPGLRPAGWIEAGPPPLDTTTLAMNL